MNSRTGRRRALSLLCGVVITGVVGLGLPSAALGSASAVPVSKAAQPTAEHAAEEAMYAKDYGVTIEEAAKRLAEQDDLGEIEQKIRDLAGSRLGCVWIQHSPDFRVVARLTEGTRIDAIDRLAANEIVSVTYDAQASLDTLTSVVERQSVAWQATYPNIELISVNEHTGQVEFYVYGEAQRNTEIADYLVGTLNSDQKFRTTVGVKADLSRFVRVLQTENHVEPANRGGRNLSNGCTSGFTGYGSSLGNVGMTTAGHCANSGGWKEFGSSTVNSMTYVKEVRNAYADLQYHTMSVMYSSFYSSSTTTPIVRTAVSSGRGSTNGKYLCHRGQTSGWSCGTVDSITENWGGYGPTCDASHPCAPVWVRMTGASLHCQGGDSGGPVHDGGTAYGSLTYCAGDHVAGFMHTDYFGTLGFVFY